MGKLKKGIIESFYLIFCVSFSGGIEAEKLLTRTIVVEWVLNISKKKSVKTYLQ